MSKVPYIKSVDNIQSVVLKVPKHPVGSMAARRSESMNTSLGFVKQYAYSVEGLVRVILIVCNILKYFLKKLKFHSR